jgi:hypothetical protein
MARAHGTNALGICDRHGGAVPWSELLLEPQTNLRVCSECIDEPIIIVPKPQPRIALPWARPNTPILIPIIAQPENESTATDVWPDLEI